MNIVELISKNADIYDALADVYGIDLIERDTLAKLLTSIENQINGVDALIDAREDDEDDFCIKCRERIAQLAMIKGFLDVLIYVQSPEAEMDDFHNFIWEQANETYEPIAGKPFPMETMKMFIGLDIKNSDDLSDHDGDFDELEYESLDEALTTWEAITRRDEMERQVR